VQLSTHLIQVRIPLNTRWSSLRTHLHETKVIEYPPQCCESSGLGRATHASGPKTVKNTNKTCPKSREGGGHPRTHRTGRAIPFSLLSASKELRSPGEERARAVFFLVPVRDVVPEQAPRDGPHEAVRLHSILAERFSCFWILVFLVDGSSF
jgi:hypothetical protein